MGFENEAEQSMRRPCHLSDGRSIAVVAENRGADRASDETNELT
jgi:hypothetical protein